MKIMNYWDGFKEGNWKKEVDVRNFIQLNYTPYEGDESFLADATALFTSSSFPLVTFAIISLFAGFSTSMNSPLLL